jgi:hypothetical protein
MQCICAPLAKRLVFKIIPFSLLLNDDTIFHNNGFTQAQKLHICVVKILTLDSSLMRKLQIQFQQITFFNRSRGSQF